MKTCSGLVALLLLPLAGLGTAGYQSSALSASVIGRAVVLHYSITGKDLDPLERLAGGCSSGEVEFSAELRKVRLLWPDLPYATTVIHNRLACDPLTRRRVLSRTVGGRVIETVDGPDASVIVPFLADLGQAVVFDAQHFSLADSQYVVRVRARVITPEREYKARVDSASIVVR